MALSIIFPTRKGNDKVTDEVRDKVAKAPARSFFCGFASSSNRNVDDDDDDDESSGTSWLAKGLANLDPFDESSGTSGFCKEGPENLSLEKKR